MSTQSKQQYTTRGSLSKNIASSDNKQTNLATDSKAANKSQNNDLPPVYAPPSTPAPPHTHTNVVIEAAKVRARDEVRTAFLLNSVS